MGTSVCSECNQKLSTAERNYSLKNFGSLLCMDHQQLLKEKFNKSQPRVVELYKALRQRGVPAEIEKFDGYKTIDIVIEEAKIHIEVDGLHHKGPQQALTDLKRTFYSFCEGYVTLHIPNSLVEFDIDETADWLTEIIVENKPRPKREWGVYR